MRNVFKNLQKPARPLIIFVFSLLIVGILPGHGAASSQAFNVLNGQPQAGMLMSLTNDPGVIAPTTTANASSLVGVVSTAADNLSQQGGQVNVQTDGVANALVSTLNGAIKVGDRITASPLEGVGAKATSSAWIVGIAQASLDAHSTNAVQTTLTDTSGQQHRVYVAQVPLVIKVTYYSSANGNGGSVAAWIPQPVQNLADSLANKQVSSRVLIFSFVLFVLGVIAAGVIISSAIRGGFLAISRQPLAKLVILKEVWRSFGAAILVLAFTLAAVTLLLRVL